MKMDSQWKEALQNPPKAYRPVPFWSWNDRLETEETRWQIAEMDKEGMGGFFMHARGGLQTDYMGREWMDNVTAGIDEGCKRGMYAWGYDENGWPSGFGSGVVNGMGERYQQKYLRWEWVDQAVETPRTIACVPHGGRVMHFYYEVNPFYVDLLDPEVTKEFLRCTHERYRDELGTAFRDMAGFFTDEPQVSRNGIPWSLLLPDAYRERYGEELSALLPGLFREEGEWKRTRFRFWQLVRDMFADHFMKQLYDWCEENGVRLTGHMVLEETLHSQLVSNGACMPCYEFMHIPGMDWLTRSTAVPATPVQVASVAHQLGKKQILSETFALCGWNVSFEELRWIYEHQMVRGVTLLCPHLEGYTLRGIRKRDYPATLFYQQPWWGDYHRFVDAMSRIGMLLSEGEVAFETLMLHPQSSAWICYNNTDNTDLQKYDDGFRDLMKELEDAQIPYHLGDERILQRHGGVEDGCLRVGTQRYRAVLVPPCLNLSGPVLKLLEAFQAAGGLIVWNDSLPALVDGEPSTAPAELAQRGIVRPMGEMAAALPQDICRVHLQEEDGDGREIGATLRRFDRVTMTYLVNTAFHPRRIKVELEAGRAARLCLEDGTLQPLTGENRGDKTVVELTLEGMGSAVLFSGLAEEQPERLPEREAAVPLKLDEDWTVAAAEPNALTLDFCDCWFDGELVGRDIPVNNIQEMACALERPVEVELAFRFTVDILPEKAPELVLETPELFRVFLNGEEVGKRPNGYYFDKSFIRLPLPQVREGGNELRLSLSFHQSPEVYENIRKSLVFESEKNKLSYDREIEAVYLIGDFGVKAGSAFEGLERQASRCTGGFALSRRPDKVRTGNLVEQGFPFFAGKITLRQTVRLSQEELTGRCLRLARRGAMVTAVRVNGKEAGKILWAPYEMALDGLLREGDNEIEVELTGTLRNLLGPHHDKNGESYVVAPGSFFQYSPQWRGGANADWDNGYCFADFGLYL